MSSKRPLFVQLFFALLLVFAQQQAVLHALGHDVERIHAAAKDVTDHDDAFCAKCLAIAHLGHAADAAGPHAIVASHSPPLVARVADEGTTPGFVGVYQSRGPPLLS